MNKFLGIIQKILEVTQFICVVLLVFYICLWFYRAFNLPYALESSPTEWIPGLFRVIFSNPTASFEGSLIDMSYLIAVGFLFVVEMVVIVLTSFVERVIYELELSEIHNKEKEERAINAELKREHTVQSMSKNHFVALLELRLDYTMEANSVENKVDFNAMLSKNYTYIRSNLKLPLGSRSDVEKNRLLICSNNFEVFDDFISNLLQRIKEVYKQNKESLVQTSFYFATEVAQSIEEIENILPILEKIESFQYRNKLVVTTEFLSRYQYSTNSKLEAKTMGISRFFGKRHIDAKGNVQYESEDFELYSMKFRESPVKKLENN